MSPRVVVVSGPDGAGKSTLCEAVAARLVTTHGPGAVVIAGIWDSLASLLTREQARAYLGQIGPRARSLLLLHGVARALELAEASGARVVLFDGYWYKYAVSELEYGASPALFEGCEVAFPRPDWTVSLDLSVARALARKGAASAYEQGNTDGAFVAFQERLRARWAALERRVGPWEHLDAERPVAALADEVAGRIAAILAPPA